MSERDDGLRWAAWFIAAVTLLRLIWHAFGPIGLTGDETYYWDWGRRLSFGYYSKPPGIAWAHWLGGFLSGQTTFGLKAFATLWVGGSLWFFYRGMRCLAPERTAKAALVMMAAVPGNLLIASFLTTDSMLVFFWNLGFWMAARLLTEEKPPRCAFAILFFALGLGALCKQMMMVQIILLWASFLWLRRDIAKRPAFIFATLASPVFLVPTLLWNISNEWITLEHTAHHFEQLPHTLPAIAGRLGFFYSVMAFLVSPALFVLLIVTVWKATAELRRTTQARRFLWLWGALPFLLMTAMVVRQGMNPNWPAVFLTSLIGMTAVYWAEHTSGKAWIIAKWTALAFSLTVMVAPFILTARIDAGKMKIPWRAWWGFDRIAEKVDAQLREGEVVVVKGHRYTTSQLAFRLEGQPRVFLWNKTGKVRSQYDLWPGPPEGTPFLLVLQEKPGKKLPKDLEKTFGALEELDSFLFYPGAKDIGFRIFRSGGMPPATETKE